MVTTQTRLNPFPGLRPFEVDEDYLFFGREGQTDELLRRLRRNRFLAVVGTSGSGKSSLVQAGLLPSLYGGFMTSAGSSWRVAVFRPGNHPIANLARALNHLDVFGSEAKDAPIHAIITETVLRRGALGLVEVVQQVRMPGDENLLIIVDQFEELFRFKQDSTRKDSGDEAAAFVKLLLEATQRPELPIYVVLIMRSDYLGDCAQFRDLPEAMNDSQYLTPRMTRDQLRRAIERPVAVGGAEMKPRLVNRLLNDVGDNPDQLPILQHALMRTWDHWVNNHEAGEPIDLPHYEAIGGMDRALSQHADEIYHQLPDARRRKIAEKLFKCLTEKGSDGRSIRRPTSLSQVCAIATAGESELIDIVGQFRARGRSFLRPSEGVELGKDSVLDISHESLTWIWQRLREWVDEEAESAQAYRRLVESAKLYQEGKARPYDDPELTIALNWREQNKPNQAWAKLYEPTDESTFKQAMHFLDKSAAARDNKIAAEVQRQQEEIDRRARRSIKSALFVVGAGFIAATVLSLVAFHRYCKVQENEIRSLQASSDALFSSDQKFNALIAGLRAGRKFQKDSWALALDQKISAFIADPEAEVKRKLETEILTTLGQAVYGVRELNLLEGHKDWVHGVSFSPDGKTIATASADETVKLWRSRDGKELRTLGEPHHRNGPINWVYGVSFSPDGKTIATASADKTVKLWRTQDGTWQDVKKPLKTLKGHTDRVLSVSFSPDGKTIATASWDKTVMLWRTQDGTWRDVKELKTLRGHTDRVNSVSFSPDGQMIATASDDYTIKLWKTRDGTLPRTLGKPADKYKHSDKVYSVSFSPDGKTIATASWDKTVMLWNQDGTWRKTLKGHTDRVYGVSFSPDGKTIATASWDKTVMLWDRNGNLLETLKGHTDRVFGVSISPDRDPKDQMIATASADKTIRLWKRNNLDILQAADSVRSVSISPDRDPEDQIIATASADKTAKLWNRDGKELRTLKHDQAILGINFSPDGQIIATASADKTAKLWNREGKKLRTLEGHKDAVFSISISPDRDPKDQIIATASADKTAKLWNREGKKLRTLRGHTDRVVGVSFSPDGKIVATASDDGTAKLWNRDGKELRTLKGHTSEVNGVSFSPDSQIIATASDDKTIKLWRVQDGKELRTLRGHTDRVVGVSFSRDGRMIASASFDKTVKLWKPDGKLLYTLPKRDDWVWSVDFSPDGQILASSGEDNTVRLWHLDKEKELEASSLDSLLESGCRKVNNYLKSKGDSLCDDIGT